MSFANRNHPLQNELTKLLRERATEYWRMLNLAEAICDEISRPDTRLFGRRMDALYPTIPRPEMYEGNMNWEPSYIDRLKHAMRETYNNGLPKLVELQQLLLTHLGDTGDVQRAMEATKDAAMAEVVEFYMNKDSGAKRPRVIECAMCDRQAVGRCPLSKKAYCGPECQRQGNY
jgi:hypothetical protein